VEDDARAPRRRPFGVKLLTLLLLGYSTLTVLLLLGVADVTVAGLARFADDAGFGTTAHALLAAVGAAAAVGLWLFRRWGWHAAMLLAGATLAVEVVLYFRGEPAFAYMAVATLIAFYLNSADVRRRFHPEEPGVGAQDHDHVPVQ
jgi:hypothetical protein